MGEAKSRGTKEERVEEAVELQETIDTAIEKRQHTEKGLVWLVIETAISVAVTDGTGAFVLGEDGRMTYGPDNTGWEALRPEDVPEWLKQDGLIKEMMDGVQVCGNPSEGGRWYRGVILTPPDNDTDDRVMH